MAPPRRIKRHAFERPSAHSLLLLNDGPIPCAADNCYLTYDSPVHWVLDEEPVELDQTGSGYPELGTTRIDGGIFRHKTGQDRNMLAYGQTIEGVINALPIDDANRIAQLAREALYWRMSVPSLIANVIAASPAIERDMNIDPTKWDTAVKIWRELAQRYGGR